MATVISLSVGATTSTLTVSDANAARIFTAARRLRGAANNQATLDAILRELMDLMINNVREVDLIQQRENEAQARISTF